MKNTTYIWLVSAITLMFCFCIGFDVSPYLRGPAYYPPEWRWEYLFENTLSKIYVPLLIILCMFLLYWWIEKQKNLQHRSLALFIVSIIALFFLLQFGVLYFSRSGIGVLIHRIINPEINGYFTAALTIQSVPEFLRTYNTIMLDFVYHAKAHPPGAILLFYYLNQIMQLFPVISEWASQQMPNRDDVRMVWNTLTASNKATVFASALFIPFLSALSAVPLYFTANALYGIKTARRALFLFALIPSLLFFIPINDAFLHLFSITALCFFVYGLQRHNLWLLTAAGIVMALGILFNLSLLPVLVLFFVYFFVLEFVNLRKTFWQVIVRGLAFTIGVFLPFISLYFFFEFNFIEVTLTIMKHVPDIHSRSYVLWIFYNLYDFFVFTGIPVACIYFYSVKENLSYVFQKKWLRIDPLVIAFTAMIFIVNFSGSVRGETGRIWIPYIPFIVLIVTAFLTNYLKLSTKQFAIILSLQVIQILVMQEFWVMLW